MLLLYPAAMLVGARHHRTHFETRHPSNDSDQVWFRVFGNNSKTVNNIKNLTWDKNDQHIKIYLPCNFEVNPITHFGVISLFS
jgi:hypothetical protein